MALFDNLDIKTTEDAMLFNQLYNTKSFAIISRSRPFLYAALGMMTPAATPLGETKFEKLSKISGDEVEVRVLGKTVDPYYMNDGADELAEVNFAGSYANDYWGAQKFKLAHLGWTHPIPASELERIKGNEAKCDNFVDEIFQLLMESYMKKYGAEFHGQGAPARNKIGGWQYAVSDGTTAGEAGFATYGQIDRAAAGNGDFQSFVLDCGGSWTMRKFRRMRNRIKKNGGTAKLAVLNEDGYTETETMLDGYTTISNDNGALWRRFDGEFVQLGKVKFALDADAPAGKVGLFDPDGVAVWASKTPFTKGGVMEMPHLKDGYGMKTKVWLQILFPRLNIHAKAINCGW